MLTAGTTHVAIGFLDLGSLASAVSLWEGKEVGGGAAGAGQPLRWVGYDSSPYAVSKTLVVAEMMRQGAATDAVVQVGGELKDVWAWEVLLGGGGNLGG